MKPFDVGVEVENPNCELLAALTIDFDLHRINPRSSSTVKSTPKLMLEAVLPTGGSNSQRSPCA